ncbi:MAG: iron-sulfur cluster assembly protein [Gemmatimonadota bacterium]|nr:iron-sulfur cluster assembly protein [Gemmatimonadota bacterium]MDP6528248.1 iron-sulfur cluster assembly protein [Gemmatimonadota bacterium]MDP6802528.1 iron-sulfur cluster assembly protein [Gemmatimonadota bacterium]MDP7031791.1 iron-sulfur cluster assembly protein [Gemmatimonadota bacterium]
MTESGNRPSPQEMREKIVAALKTVFDPEIPVDIWEMGLVYRLDVTEDGVVSMEMTLTSPMCPVAESLPEEARQKAAQVEGVERVSMELVWEPPWGPDRMSESAKLALGMF